MEEGFDVAIRVRERLDTEQDLIPAARREQADSHRRPSASIGTHSVCAVTDPPNGPLLAGGDEVIDQRWVLQREDGATFSRGKSRTSAADRLRQSCQHRTRAHGQALVNPPVCNSPGRRLV